MVKRIRKGSYVRLNSGGPVMSVYAIIDNEALVEWNGEKPIIYRDRFPMVCLTLVVA